LPDSKAGAGAIPRAGRLCCLTRFTKNQRIRAKPASCKFEPIIVSTKDEDMSVGYRKSIAFLYHTCEWERIEEMLKVVLSHLPDIHHRSFDLARKACEDFFNLPEHFKDLPTTKQALEILSGLHQNGMSFYELLNGLSPYLKDLFIDRYALSVVSKSKESLEFLEELDKMRRLSMDKLYVLEKHTKIVADLADKLKEGFFVKKMEPQRPRRGFIRTMATAYEKSTGRPARKAMHCDSLRTEGKFKGEFFDLIWDCLVAAGARPHSQRALYEDINKKLKGRKLRIDPWGATK
jgi:hypothetical protein